MEREVILRDDALDGLAEDGDVGGGLGKEAMDAEGHVALDDAEGGEAAWRQAEEMVVRPAEKTGINRVYPEGRIFPLDEPVEGGAATLWEMEIDQGRGIHGTAGIMGREGGCVECL